MITTDKILCRWMARLIEKKSKEPKEKKVVSKNHIHLLLAGYNGSRNTGADVRVEEMIRQFKHLLPKDKLSLTVLTMNTELTQGYFEGAYQKKLPDIFPYFLFREIDHYDGVVACEGSMFKSKFANALTVMMGGALGLANAAHKMSLAYGAEAGSMDAFIQAFVEKYCSKSLVICRNKPSMGTLSGLGIQTSLGTDTAWTFEASSRIRSTEILKKIGWDGKQNILFICPINPFWWPVKPDLFKFLLKKIVPSAFNETHYKSIYFHDYKIKQKEKYYKYLYALKNSIEHLEKKYNLKPVLVAMEKLDEKACQDLSEMCTNGKPILTSRDYNMYDLVGMLRLGSFMISSRYHGIVTSMPSGVPSVGVTMDERIQNLMIDRNHSDLTLNADQDDLSEKLISLSESGMIEREKISNEILKHLPCQLKKMSDMGKMFLSEVERFHPNLMDYKNKMSFEHYLPPLNKNLQQLLEAA